MLRGRVLYRPSPLSALYEVELRSQWGSRLAKLCAAAVLVGYGVVLMVVATSGDPAPLDSVTANASGWIVWTTGVLVALSAARNAARIERTPELVALIRQRGLSSGLHHVRPLAVGSRIARLVGIPVLGLGLLAVALSHSTELMLSRLVFVGLLVIYVAFAAATLAVLTEVALRLTPERAAWILGALLLIPHLAREAWPLVPSVPAFLSWLLGSIKALAALVP